MQETLDPKLPAIETSVLPRLVNAKTICQAFDFKPWFLNKLTIHPDPKKRIPSYKILGKKRAYNPTEVSEWLNRMR